MPTTLNVDMAKWAGTEMAGPVTLTYDGATPTDPGPAGAVVRMLVAQVSNDAEGMKRAVTAKTLEMGKPALPGQTVTASLGEVAYEGDTAIVPGKLNADGQDQEISFVTVKEDGAWKVDMHATIERLMGGSMEALSELMEQGMKTMADGMSAALGGMGEAFGGDGREADGGGDDKRSDGTTAVDHDHDDGDRDHGR